METQEKTIGDSVPEIELTYTPPLNILASPKILSSEEAYRIFIEKWDTSKLEFVEQFKVLLLNRANRPLGVCTLSTGGSSSTIIDIRLLFALAIKTNASAIIVAHNHPSGELTPSKYDVETTKRIDEAGKILDIPLHDHLIVSKYSYYSLKNEGAF